MVWAGTRRGSADASKQSSSGLMLEGFSNASSLKSKAEESRKLFVTGTSSGVPVHTPRSSGKVSTTLHDTATISNASLRNIVGMLVSLIEIFHCL